MALVFSLATAIVSDDLAGAQIDMNPHFTFDKTEVAVGEFVTFINLTKGGIIPYTKAEWDFDGDDDIDITCEKDDPSNPKPMDIVHWAYTESGIYKPMLRMTDSAGAVGVERIGSPPITVLYEPTPTPPSTPPPSCPSPHLTATITAISTSSPSVGEQYTVTAQVTNTGAGDATDVTATLGYSRASIVAGANPQPLGNLASGQSATANWILRCDGVGYVAITIDPEGINACSLQAIPEWNTDEASNGVRQACFIATAAYGTSTAEEIDTLRAFRDDVLLQNSLGSQFVAFYYEVSPPVADFISEHDPLRTLVRELLVDPVAWLVEATGTLWRD